jgi:hypothetical protein
MPSPRRRRSRCGILVKITFRATCCRNQPVRSHCSPRPFARRERKYRGNVFVATAPTVIRSQPDFQQPTLVTAELAAKFFDLNFESHLHVKNTPLNDALAPDPARLRRPAIIEMQPKLDQLNCFGPSITMVEQPPLHRSAPASECLSMRVRMNLHHSHARFHSLPRC